MLVTKDKIVALAVAVFIINLCLFIFGILEVNSAFNREDNNVYVICDVYDVVYNGNTVLIDITLPNGELLTRQMSIDDDLPEEFSEVVIKTSNLDDYSKYQIVGMR